MELVEQDIKIDFSNAIDALIFDQMKQDQPHYHGIGQMGRVDFVVELTDIILFIEIKDLENPYAKDQGINDFIDKLNSGKLGESFAKKYTDTFIYRWAEDKLTKPIHYVCLITFDQELLVNLADEIARNLPPFGRNVPRWKRNFLETCVVLNLQTWNKVYPQMPASRLSSTSSTL